MRKLGILVFVFIGAILFAAIDSEAQRPGPYGGGFGPPDGGRRDGVRGPEGGPGEGLRGPGGDSRDRSSRFEGFLRTMDANGNGVLEPNEIPEDRKRMLAGIAGRLGLDANGPIKLDKIREAMKRRHAPQRRPEEKSTKSTKSTSDSEPLVPGFGVEQEAVRVPAFGERVDYAALVSSASVSRKSSSPSSPASSSRSDSGRESRYRHFAQAMFRRYDKNKSGFLEKDEWGPVRNAEAADGNHDGKITPDELANQLAAFGRGRSGEGRGGASESNGSSGANASRTTPSDGRKSYRFLTPTERLPGGLPDWFARNDANGDGQVAMAEYAASWSDSKVREFDRYDLNRDGLITPRECLDAENDEVELADVGSAAPSGGSKGGLMAGPVRRPTGSSSSGTSRVSSGSPPKASKDQGGSTPWWMQ